MSFARLPRLHFKGQFETDVCTANNDDIVPAIDPLRVAIRFGTNGVPTTDVDFVQWMRSPAQSGTTPNSSWNYYGGNGCKFVDCRIVSVDVGNGLLVDPVHDPAIGGSVSLGDATTSGIMVDLSPEGTWGTQIFADAMEVTSQEVRLHGVPSVAVSRWLHFGRNTTLGGFTGAAATWQAAIAAADLSLTPTATGALALLGAAAEAARGVVIRYCTYMLAPRASGQELLSQYAQGGSPRNPAIGLVIGSIGVWEDDDYASQPNGRLLLPTGELSWNHGPVRFGPATVAIDRTRCKAVVDLVTTVPEIDAAGTKLSAGTATLVVQPADGSAVEVLGSMPYDQATYELGGGLVEVDLTSPQLAVVESGRLAIAFDDAPLLAEATLAIDTDDRNVYFDVDEERELTIRVRARGAAPATPVTLRIDQHFSPEKIESPSLRPEERALEHPEEVVTDANGVARVAVRARRPQIGYLRFVPDGYPDESDLPTTGCLVNFRVLPIDDYDHIPDEQLSFEFIYQQVLRYYHLIYPAMGHFISLADEQQVIAAASMIRSRIRPELHDRWAYMPRTRELSAGKRRLLDRWLTLVAP